MALSNKMRSHAEVYWIINAYIWDKLSSQSLICGRVYMILTAFICSSLWSLIVYCYAIRIMVWIISFVLTTHLISIKRADWPKLHDMSKTRDCKAWQRKFPVGYPVTICALNLLLINIFLDVVTRIGSRCVIKEKYVLLVCKFVRFFAGKTALALKRSCNFSREKSNEMQTNKTCLSTYTH